jgi:hypothetical protein
VSGYTPRVGDRKVPDPMSGYTPQVGDRVTQDSWPKDTFVTVTAVGEGRFLARPDGQSVELSYVLDWDWVKVPEPVVYPERWINVYPDYLTKARWSSMAAAERIAVIHLAADGTLTLHPVERES